MTLSKNTLALLGLALLYSASGFHFITPARLWQSKSTVFSLFDTESVTPFKSKYHQVYIKNIPTDWSENDVASAIKEKAGDTVKGLRLAKDLQTGDFRGFGYVDFEHKEEAEAAVAALSGVDLNGKELQVSLAHDPKPKLVRPPFENSCFIGNLDYTTTEEQVTTLCNERLGNGKVVRVRLATDRTTGKHQSRFRPRF
jgi:RNA recognition motif-containing protein